MINYLDKIKNSGVTRRLFLILGSFIAGVSLSAQTSLKVDAPRVVESGESFQVIFSVNAEPSSFNLPSITDFDLLAGPSQSRMSSTQIINGKRSESIQISYTYVLAPRSEGKFTIPSATVVVDGKSYSSSPVTIEVVKGDGSAKSSESAQTGTTVSSDDLFLKISLSKGRVVKGEHLIATVKLYTKVPIAGFEDVRFPSFNGFWSQEIDTPQNIEFVRESIDGKIYNSALLRRYMLLPQQSGTLTIDAAEMICQVQIRTTGGASRSLFDDFFDSYSTVRKRVSSTAVRVVVDPLPQGAPASFQGGVGEFTMSAKLSRDSINANEALSLIVNISGTGNINLIEAPKITFPAGFEVYDTKISDNSSKGSRGASGSKQFEYPIIPRGPGEYTIPKVEFTFYDIAKKRYITLFSDDLNLKVGRDAGGGSVSQPGLSLGVNRQAVRSITEDIRYIHSGASRLKKGNLFFFASLFYFFTILMIISLYIFTEKILSKRVERNRDIAGVKNRRANKVARARLKNAETLLKQGIYMGFYEELHRALLGYVSDKLNLSLADLSRDKIREELVFKKVNFEQIDELLYLLEQCEYARYAPDPGGGEMDKNYTKAIRLISEMEL
ncbi:MAG: BatD family protein [Bacteroidales bacterium]|nr:BatD family protein [Bacteroidales bacterium]